MVAGYVELHAKSFYSFGEGASHTHELLAQAKEHAYASLALTDTNLCGALEFARLAGSLGIQPITGGELTLDDGSRLVLLAGTRQGYANISRLFTLANAVDRREPRLDPAHLPAHAEGVVLLTGGRDGRLSRLALEGRRQEARELLKDYMKWYGSEYVYVELQQNFLKGDTARNRELARLAQDMGAPVVATNDVHYHIPGRYKLQQALVAAKRNSTIDQALPFIRPNHHLHLKSQAQMDHIFKDYPEAISNTLRIAEQCAFDLSTDLGYNFPEPAVPEGYTAESYLERLCFEAALRCYGSMSKPVKERLEEEFRLIERHRLAGYLIGISHVDPLRWGLTLERFISEDTSQLPDIDLDFPRGLRDELIRRVHEHLGPDYAVLAGAVATYSVKGIIQDLGKALGLLGEDLKLLSKQPHSHDGAKLKEEMLKLPAFRDKVDAQGWRELIELAPQLMHAPRSLGQHVGGMVLSDSPISGMVPIRAGAINGRYIMDWNKDSVADANFAKIDLLSLPVLDQLEEALGLIEEREGRRPDLSRIDPGDPGVYDMINAGLSKGIFLLQSPAQLKMGQRLKSRTLLDLAYQVALIRPGVGVQGSAVSRFVERYRPGVSWEYDHPLEERAQERGYGIIVWQEQVVQLIMDVPGFTAAQADEVRQAFARPHSDHLIAGHRERFLEGAQDNGVPEDVAEEDIRQDQWALHVPRVPLPCLCRHRLPGYIAEALLPPGVLRRADEQPAYGPLPLGDAQGGCPALRGVLPQPLREPEPGEMHPRAGLRPAGSPAHQGRGGCGSPARRRGEEGAWPIRRSGGPGAEDGPQAPGRAVAGSGRGLRCRHLQPQGSSLGCRTPHTSLQERSTGLPRAGGGRRSAARRLHRVRADGGRVPGHGHLPQGHLMEFVRPTLSSQVLPAAAVEEKGDGEEVLVAGWPVARQHPRGQDGTVFVTIEDETGDVQLILWPRVFVRCRRVLGNQVILARGRVSRWDGTTNVVVSEVRAVRSGIPLPTAHDWY